MQDMFSRIVVEHCQKNLACTLLHMKNVMKALRNDVKNERKYMQKVDYVKTAHDVLSLDDPHPE